MTSCLVRAADQSLRMASDIMLRPPGEKDLLYILFERIIWSALLKSIFYNLRLLISLIAFYQESFIVLSVILYCLSLGILIPRNWVLLRGLSYQSCWSFSHSDDSTSLMCHYLDCFIGVTSSINFGRYWPVSMTWHYNAKVEYSMI